VARNACSNAFLWHVDGIRDTLANISITTDDKHKGEHIMANPDHRGDGAPPRDIHVGPATRKTGWLPWLLLGLGILALLFGLKRCNRADESAHVAAVPAATPATVPATETAAPRPVISGVGSYLGGTEAVPRTFVFEKLNFDTNKSEIRAADRDELNALAATLKQYPNSRIRIVGYADARGPAPANATLGKERADSVKAALVAEGIAAARLDTASGGETNPVDTNATPSGRFENRRTELIVLQR
jgi:outer membrane protein OmpA-like peptidoglycan-associated protein